MLQDEGLTPEAARKRLERAKPPVSRLESLRLPNGGYFWYLPEQFQTDEYWQQLVGALEETGSAYGAALSALDAHGGLVPALQFPAISGSPVAKSGHLGVGDVRDTLVDLELLEQFEDPILGSCLRFTRHAPFNLQSASERRAVLVAEDVLLAAFADWLRKMTLVSYNSVRLRKDAEIPEFGQYHWDCSALSYVYPLKTSSKKKASPGFVVADVVLKDGLTLKDAEYFFRKCSSLRSTRGIFPFLATLIATRFEPDVLKKGREAGLLLATPTNLFGKEVERALKEIVRMLSSATLSESPEQIENIFRGLDRFDGALQQLRGPLFELLVGYCIQTSQEGQVRVNLDVFHEGEQVNVDVLHIKGTQDYAAYECKGRLSETQISREEIEDWLTRQVPRILGHFRDHPDLSARRATVAFWTSGRFSPEALAYLAERKDATRRYSIEWKDGESVRKYARENRLSGVVQTLDQYYRSTKAGGL